MLIELKMSSLYFFMILQEVLSGSRRDFHPNLSSAVLDSSWY